MLRAAGARLVIGAPEAVAAAAAGFSVGPMILLLLGHFTPALALPVGFAGAAIAACVCGLPRAVPTGGAVLIHVAAAAFCLLWFLYNVRYTAQDVYATRDPATYTITGRWLVDHPTLQIPTHLEIFGSPTGGVGETGGYALVSPGTLNAQGNHLLPALAAMLTWIFGSSAIFHANVVISAVALFVFFGLARRVVTPILALAAMSALALSMPLIYVGRDSYTEPLTLLFLMGALALVHRGYASGRIRDFALAGLVGGSAAMARIDSYGGLIGLVAAAAVYVMVTGDRRAAVLRGAALLGGAAVTTAIGWLDLVHLSRQYYNSQHHNIVLLLLALFGVVILSPLVVAVGWRPGVRSWLAREHSRRVLALSLNGLVVVAFAVLASRPLWLTSRGDRNANLENMQARWNHAIDGTRTYHEQTVHWLALYLGWGTVVVAVAGYCVLITAFLRRREYALSGVLTMGLTMSALYLWNGQIAPDQPWAMRRYVPVIMPLLLVAAGAAVQEAWEHRGPLRFRWMSRVILIVAVGYGVWFPWKVTEPMRHVRDEVPQLVQLDALCSAIGTRGAVVEADEPTVFGYGQTLRSFCNVPTINLDAPLPVELAAMRSAALSHGRTLFVLAQNPDFVPVAPGSAKEPFSVVTVQRWPTQINVAPTLADTQTYAMYLYVVDPAGSAQPVPPAR
jgi:hypothetical protein